MVSEHRWKSPVPKRLTIPTAQGAIGLFDFVMTLPQEQRRELQEAYQSLLADPNIGYLNMDDSADMDELSQVAYQLELVEREEKEKGIVLGGPPAESVLEAKEEPAGHQERTAWIGADEDGDPTTPW